ncbi:MAG: UDP-N-acetylmuramate dehydrogenase [Deltaproteobacteria bacterium]|nr:UDP-N-acetylmuramate dehydrogenase [Deltaproteobacteria bacterium]
MLLKNISYYQTGTTCDQLLQPQSINELIGVFQYISRKRINYFLIGSGSNSLIMDDHWPGAVISFSQMKKCSINGNIIKTEAGVKNSKFAELCLDANLAGASWMNALPGQIGATTRMNARCYGGEISNIVKSVKSITSKGKIKEYPASEVFLGYKNTIFIDNREIIAEVEFDLKPGNKEEISAHMQYCKKDRNLKHQFLYPSCGCVFKNNYQANVPSGLLLEKAGVRKFSTPKVEISPYHANFVFNKGVATAREILDTTFKMRDAVYQKFGVWLEYEMEVLGNISGDLKSQLNFKKEQCFNSEALLILQQEFENSQKH